MSFSNGLISKWFGFFLLGVLVGLATTSQPVNAALEAPRASDTVVDLLKRQVAERFTGARVEATSAISWQSGAAPEQRTESVRILGELSPGVVQFVATSVPNEAGERSVTTGSARFAAFIPAKVASRRVLPGERLKSENFQSREVDIATGMGREYRGAIVEPSQNLDQLESRQTILEGQFLVSSAIRRVHDIRKGDSVRIELLGESGLRVSLSGTAEEPGYLDDSVKVIANRTKRTLIGKLRGENLVEVKL